MELEKQDLERYLLMTCPLFCVCEEPLFIRIPGEYSGDENTVWGDLLGKYTPITRYEFRRYLQAC